jgi:hypothetical protein
LAQNINEKVLWEGDALQEEEKTGQVHGIGYRTRKVMTTHTHVTKIEYKIVACLKLLCYRTRMESMIMPFKMVIQQKSSLLQDRFIDCSTGNICVLFGFEVPTLLERCAIRLCSLIDSNLTSLKH